MKRRRKTPPRIPIEEFFEYGDVNGKPLVEVKKGRNNPRKAEK